MLELVELVSSPALQQGLGNIVKRGNPRLPRLVRDGHVKDEPRQAQPGRQKLVQQGKLHGADIRSQSRRAAKLNTVHKAVNSTQGCDHTKSILLII